MRMGSGGGSCCLLTSGLRLREFQERQALLAVNPADTLLLGVLELWQGLDRLLGRARQHELAILLLQLIHWNGHVVLANAHEASRADDDERDRSVRSDDEVVDGPDLLILLVINRLAKDLLLCTPPNRYRPRLLDCDPDPGRARNLRGSIALRGEQHDAR